MKNQIHISSYHLKDIQNKGQSVIEFLISFTFMFIFLIVFVYTAIAIADGMLVHYVTFSASRMYLSYDSNSNTVDGGDANAQTYVTNEVVSKFPLSKLLPESGEWEFLPPQEGENTPYIGVIYRFKHKISPVKMFGGNELVDFTSESFLGREPSKQECLENVLKSLEAVGVYEGNIQEGNATLYDNGC